MRELPKGWIPGKGLHLGGMIVGEAPGATEEAEGEPFVGASGALLRDTLSVYGVDPAEMYITNVVKWRPPNNATPNAEDIEKGLPYLEDEIQHVVPRYILALGNTAFQTLVGTELGITLYRGFWRRLAEGFDWEEALVLPTFHPAYVLRDRSKLPIFQKDVGEFAKTWLKGRNEPID